MVVMCHRFGTCKSREVGLAIKNRRVQLAVGGEHDARRGTSLLLNVGLQSFGVVWLIQVAFVADNDVRNGDLLIESLINTAQR